MLKDIIENSVSNFKTLKPISFNTEVDMYEYNMEGVVEVIARKDDKVIHHDVDHNHVTFFAKQAQIQLMREAVYSYYGEEFDTTSAPVTTSTAMSGNTLAISKRAFDTSEVLHSSDTEINVDGTLISGLPFFQDNKDTGRFVYPKNFFEDRDDGTGANYDLWSGSGGADSHDYPFFPTKILLGTGVEFSDWFIDGAAVGLPADATTVPQKATMEYAYDAFIAADGDDPLSYQDPANVAGGAYAAGWNPTDGTDTSFKSGIDMNANWYSATYDPAATADSDLSFPDTSTGIPGYLIQTRTVNHLISGKIPEANNLQYPWEEGVDTYPVDSAAYRLKSVDPHDYSYAVRGAIKTLITDFSETSFLKDGGYSVEGIFYEIPKMKHLGIGRPCFIYVDKEISTVTKGEIPSDGTWTDASKADDFIETQITFKAILPKQNAGEYYPYNTFVLKEAGLFNDAKHFIGAYHFNDADNPAIGDVTGNDSMINAVGYSRKMPAGMMWAKRKIAPVYKEANIEIEINWTLKFA